MGKLVYLFPGQGSQAVGMGSDLCAHSPAAMLVFEEADSYFGFKISTLCFYGPEESLRQTNVTQPALFVTSVAALRALEEAGAPRPDAVAGHSVGEYAALVAAGVLTLADGLHLVERRAQEMQRAAEAAPGAMAAVLGLGASDVQAACAEAEQGGAGTVRTANFNGGGQVVISGTLPGVEKAAEVAKLKGAKRVVTLNVSGAFHSPLMGDAAQAMARVLADVKLQDASIPVVANLTADYETAADAIRRNLAAQIDHPVRWEETITRLVADGCDTFVEVGQGAVLVGLMKRLAPGAKTYGAADAAGVAAVVAALHANSLETNNLS